MVGRSSDVLRLLAPGAYDFAYIDGAHEAKHVISDAVLVWPLLEAGGFLLFDDYNFTFAATPEQNTAQAIDFFLRVYADELEVIDKGAQVLLRKRHSKDGHN